MKPEYQLTIEGLGCVERIVNGLMDNGYIVSTKKKSLDTYLISIYGKEKVEEKKSSHGYFYNNPNQVKITPLSYGETTTKIPSTTWDSYQ